MLWARVTGAAVTTAVATAVAITFTLISVALPAQADTVTTSWATGLSQPQGIAIAGDNAYVTNSGAGTVSKIQLSDGSVVATSDSVTDPNGIAIAGGNAYVTLNGGTLAKIDLSAFTAAPTTLAVGANPAGVVVDLVGAFAYSTNKGADTVSKVAITKEDQSITFTPPSTPLLLSATPAALVGTSTSGLPVVFTTATPSVCTVADTAVTLVAIGTCTINANQAGNTNLDAATQVQRSFEVLDKTAQTITFAGPGFLPSRLGPRPSQLPHRPVYR